MATAANLETTVLPETTIPSGITEGIPHSSKRILIEKYKDILNLRGNPPDALFSMFGFPSIGPPNSNEFDEELKTVSTQLASLFQSEIANARNSKYTMMEANPKDYANSKEWKDVNEDLRIASTNLTKVRATLQMLPN